MADEPYRTMIATSDEGTLSFQEWFVHRRAEPRVGGVRFEGEGTPAPGVIDAIESSDLVVIGPSNPFVSIDPILGLDGVRDALQRKPVVAVSPIVAGKAVKGPLATMIHQLTGQVPSAGAIARHYRGLIRAMVVERGDENTVPAIPVAGTATVMRSADDRLRLASELLSFASEVLR
jgi:LPPG:FO 2-phospho-L-lactate transferase